MSGEHFMKKYLSSLVLICGLLPFSAFAEKSLWDVNCNANELNEQFGEEGYKFADTPCTYPSNPPRVCHFNDFDALTHINRLVLEDRWRPVELKTPEGVTSFGGSSDQPNVLCRDGKVVGYRMKYKGMPDDLFDALSKKYGTVERRLPQFSGKGEFLLRSKKDKNIVIQHTHGYVFYFRPDYFDKILERIRKENSKMDTQQTQINEREKTKIK